MKTWQLRSFLEEFLSAQGATTERKGDNLLVVQSPKKLVPAIGAKELVVAFNLRGVQEDPRSELGTVGNPVFDRILELARESGRVGQRFEKLPGDLAEAVKVPPEAGKTGNGKTNGRRSAGNGKGAAEGNGKTTGNGSGKKAEPAGPPDPQEHYRLIGRGVKVGAPVPTYTPVYYVIFRIEYSLEELADELEIVPIDGVSLQPLGQTPELTEYWEGLETEPAPDRTPSPAFPIPPEVIRTAVRLIEKRLRKRLAKIRREADEHLTHETESIENYYKQLIEETRNASRRWALPAGGREERIRLLQLDWKRRIEEAQAYWRPSLDVRLAAVAAAQRPRLAYPVKAGGARGQGEAAAGPRKSAVLSEPRTPEHRSRVAEAIPPVRGHSARLTLYWDETERRFIDPPCRGCGTPGQKDLTPSETGFLCPRCSKLTGTALRP